MRLVDAVSQRTPRTVALRTGTVVAFTDPTCTVDLAGATLTDVPKLASYVTPAADDVVLLLQSGAQVVILGTVG